MSDIERFGAFADWAQSPEGARVLDEYANASRYLNENETIRCADWDHTYDVGEWPDGSPMLLPCVVCGAEAGEEDQEGLFAEGE